MTPILEPRPKCALSWNDEQLSYTELLHRVWKWSRLLPVADVRVVIFSENTPAWVCGAYAIWAAHGVLVPVDHLSTAEELAYVIDDCDPMLVLCSRHLQPTVVQALEHARHQPWVVVLEELPTNEPSSSPPVAAEALVVDESTLCAIVYTSGTTGAPKGVMLSFGNLLTNVRAVANAGYFTDNSRVLLLLPLHHVLPLAGSLVAPLFAGSTVVFATALAGEALVLLLQRHAITTVVGVPRFYDLLHRALTDRIQEHVLSRSLFALARRIRSHAFSRLVFGSVHRKFGGALKHLICGGAALSPDTAETFDVLGFSMCEGYGMTECAPMITFPRLHHIKIGSCGQVLDGCEVQIADGGEILARGPNVMLGYYNRQEETQALIRDGWLHTGDLGHLDADGYLYVTGRLKEILVLGSGKKVNPTVIESALSASPAVHEAGVFLDGDALHALVLPQSEQLPSANRHEAEGWLRSNVIEPYNATVAPYRRVARLTLVNEALPRTRLGKLRRHQLPAVAARLAKLAAKTPEMRANLDQTLGRLVTFLERQSGQAVEANQRLLADLGLDSLGRVELSVFIERAFDLTIPEAQFLELETVADLARVVDSLKRADLETSTDISWAEILHPLTPPPLPHSSVYHRAIAYLSRFLVRALFRIQAKGQSHLPKGPFILVPNHQSYIDGLFVCAFLGIRVVLQTLFYAKEQHVRKRFLKFLAPRCNTILMDAKAGFLISLQQLAAGLARGNNLIIFPEGTRSRDGTLGAFKDSYAILAQELGVPVVPVVIDGAYAVLPTGRRFPDLKRPISVTYLEAVHPEIGELPAAFNARVRATIATALERGRKTP